MTSHPFAKKRRRGGRQIPSLRTSDALSKMALGEEVSVPEGFMLMGQWQKLHVAGEMCADLAESGVDAAG
jgi:hypothetical protein